MLARVPLLRILAPFIVGILLTNAAVIDGTVAIIAIATTMCVPYAIARMLRKNPLSLIKMRPLLSGCVMASALLAGWLAASVAVPAPTDTSAINGKNIIARIDEISNNDFSTSLQATLESCPENHAALPDKIPISVIIKANDYSLQEGDLISFTSCLTRIRSLGNPEEFDYARYMRHKGILYTQTLEADSYDKVGESDNIFTYSRSIQRHIANTIINSGMNPDTQRFLCTILLGESSYLEPETRFYYSKAGISHILALSGLHMGIIAGILFLLLKPLCYVGLHKVRIIIVIPLLIAYLFITGMAPSAMRSAIMAVFVFTAWLLHRQNSSLNALAASALVILAASPYALYDVGFQLSFAAVLTILLFYNKLMTVSPRRKVLYYWMSSLSLTTIATLGTAVISAYYFHVIPLLAIVSNIIVLPLLPAYLCLALLHTALLLAGMEVAEFSFLLDQGATAIDFVAASISDLPFSSVTQVSISTTTLVLFMALYVTITAWVYKKKYAYAMASLAIILAICVTELAEFISAPRSGLVIQNDYASTPIIYFTGDECTTWCPDDSIDIDKFNRNNMGFLSHYHLNAAKQADGISSKSEFIEPPFAYIEGKRLAVISNTRWRHYRATKPIEIDYLVITKSYYGNIADLLDTFKPNSIILSGGIYSDKNDSYLTELHSMTIPFHDLHADGAIFTYTPF